MKFSISIHAHCSSALLVEQGANCGSNNLHSLIAFNATRRRQNSAQKLSRKGEHKKQPPEAEQGFPPACFIFR